MFVVYLDDKGDKQTLERQGSPFFTLTATCVHVDEHESCQKSISGCRAEIEKAYGLLAKLEIHINDLIQGKKPYYQFRLSDTQRKNLLTDFYTSVSKTNMCITSVVIEKTDGLDGKQVVQSAVSQLLYAVEDHLLENHAGEYFRIVSDMGQEGDIRPIIHWLQKQEDNSQARKLRLSTASPEFMDSRLSPYIQISDAVCFLAYHYIKMHSDIGLEEKIYRLFTLEELEHWLNILKPCFNPIICRREKHGFGIIHSRV